MKNAQIKRGISLLLVVLLAIGLLPISHLMAEPVDKGSLSDCCDSIGVLFFDGNDRAVEAGTDGFFEVQENDPYQLVFQFRSSAGFEPGRYTYDIPADGITISDSISEGQVIVDRVVIGEWTLTGNCLTVTFNGLSADYSNVDVAIKIGCSFEGLGERTILDGAAKVRVVPVVLTEPGIKKGGSADDDLLMLHWSVLIQGGDGFPVVGQTLTDQLGSNQKYIDSEVTLVANTGEESYRFTVPVTCSPAGDAADATSWSYTFPSKLTDDEGVERTLSDEWSYLFEYSTERTDSNTVGTVIYYNEATVNDVTYEGQIKVKLSDLDIDLTKTVADAAEDGSIAKNWTVSFTIPASSDLAQYPVWRIQDTMQVRDEDNTLLAQASALGGLDNATVTIAYGGREYTAQKYVPGTTPTADFLFRVSSNNKQLYLIKKCTCEGTEHCGSVAHGECATSWVEPLDGYCACWNLDSDAVVTVQYTTTDESM
ncbi:MAG: hypothetical protein IKI63_01020, partial [Clostridia bacterium]|nr:hypothetical protein [Clostridia bacterium]